MLKTRFNKKGVVLFIVLSTLLIVVALASVVLSVILSHSRLTQHQSGRIQAYYATKAGIDFALEQLRLGVWSYPANCPNTNPATCTVGDTQFPDSIKNHRVDIIFCPSGQICYGSTTPCVPPSGSGINFCVNATATYITP